MINVSKLREGDDDIMSDAPSFQAVPRLVERTRIGPGNPALAKIGDVPDLAIASQKIRLLAEILGRQAAHRHLARGYSLIEIAAALAVAALLLGALLLAGQWSWVLHIIPTR